MTETILLHMDRLDIDGSRINSGYSFGGILYANVGNAVFPDEDWYDWVYYDLKRWIPEIVSFGLNHTDSCVLWFMDGPFYIKFLRRTDGSISVACTQNQAVEISETTVDFWMFLKSLTKIVQKYDRLLYEHGLPAQFTNELTLLRKLLKNENGMTGALC